MDIQPVSKDRNMKEYFVLEAEDYHDFKLYEYALDATGATYDHEECGVNSSRKYEAVFCLLGTNKPKNLIKQIKERNV